MGGKALVVYCVPCGVGPVGLPSMMCDMIFWIRFVRFFLLADAFILLIVSCVLLWYLIRKIRNGFV